MDMKDDDLDANVIAPAKPIHHRHKSGRDVEPFGGVYRRAAEILAAGDAQRLEAEKLPLPSVQIEGQEQPMDYQTACFQRFEDSLKMKGYMPSPFIEPVFPEYAREIEAHRTQVTASERLAIRAKRYNGEDHEPALGEMQANPAVHELRPANLDLPIWERDDESFGMEPESPENSMVFSEKDSERDR